MPAVKSTLPVFILVLLCIAHGELDDADPAEVDGIIFPDHSMAVPDHTTVTAGGQQSCALRRVTPRTLAPFSGTVECWGGTKRSGVRDVPEGYFAQISAGEWHVCGVREDEVLRCWGAIKHAPEGDFIQVSTGSSFSCGLRTDRTLECWGRNDFGKTDAPKGQFRQISCGHEHACAIDTHFRAVCWGLGTVGQLDVPEGVHFVQISSGGMHSCGLEPSGAVRCWGDDARGQLRVPKQHGPFKHVSTMHRGSCAVTATNGAVVCWGKVRNVPNIKAETNRGFLEVAAGKDHLCATRKDSVECYGKANTLGQLDVPEDLLPAT